MSALLTVGQLSKSFPGVKALDRVQFELQSGEVHALTRLFMWMEVDPLRYNEDAMALAAQTNPVIQDWETWMWTFQRPTPWTPAGLKWVPMNCIFDLTKQGM